MQNYKLTIQYDGSRYSGWQVQGNTEQTVQGKLQRVLGELDGGEVEVHGSGRTDAGVHARAQIANVRLRTEPDWIQKLWVTTEAISAPSAPRANQIDTSAVGVAASTPAKTIMAISQSSISILSPTMVHLLNKFYQRSKRKSIHN